MKIYASRHCPQNLDEFVGKDIWVLSYDTNEPSYKDYIKIISVDESGYTFYKVKAEFIDSYNEEQFMYDFWEYYETRWDTPDEMVDYILSHSYKTEDVELVTPIECFSDDEIQERLDPYRDIELPDEEDDITFEGW